jgi:hypothetical protein
MEFSFFSLILFMVPLIRWEEKSTKRGGGVGYGKDVPDNETRDTT